MRPRFFFCTDDMRKIWNNYGVFFSEKFCCFFSDKVEEIIKRDTGMTASTKVGLSSYKQENDLPMYEIGETSILRIAISILPEFYDNINFCWSSKNGRIVKTTDEDFNESDLEYWIEGLKPALYWEQVSSVIQKHPFQSDLPFKLIVRNFGALMKLRIEVADEDSLARIRMAIKNLVEEFNRKSESNNRKPGVVHNFSIQVDDNIIELRIDLGSAGLNVIKKILKLLSSFDRVLQVEIDF